MCMKQSKEEQLEILQKECQKAIDTYHLPTFVLCCYLKVMLEKGLCKPDIYYYFTEFPVTDILNECRAIVDRLVGEYPGLKECDVYGTQLGKLTDLHMDAVEIDTFMETHLDLPIDEEPSYLNSIERMMNAARQSFDIVDFAYWWSAWNITKVRGHLDNSFWENRIRLDACGLFDTLNEFMNVQMAKDSQGNYIHDAFKNPSMDIDWEVPCEPVHLAIKCLKHFIDLDDLPQA